ncbi:MAG: homoserine dehydrogenase [Actinobacteria bacterium]|nr:homoserine dehydrogenase [Actinomycetota bacterium]OPZ78799.1 MAG: Homoserine dehydrogenase [Actinobacteria bacterium ADurb.Bin444]
MSERVRMGLLGFGTVGSAFYRLVEKERATILEATGTDLEVRWIAELDRSKHGLDAPVDLFTTDAAAVVGDPEVDVVVELIGGVDTAFELLEKALHDGKNVVTANKQLLANRGGPLFDLARETGRQIRYEACVAGAVPVVKVMRESMTGAGLHTVYGIVNGTTNYILTAMQRGEGDYATTLAAAQRMGYAEADPTDDVSGADAAAKMAILASIAFHSRITMADVSYEGIEGIKPEDIAQAAELGFVVKLVGRARYVADRVNVRVGPVLVPCEHPLASVAGSDNAVLLEGSEIDRIMLSGPGAGGRQTATAVLADVVSIANSKSTGFLQQCSCYRSLGIFPNDEMESAFFIRVRVEDRAGVLAQLASVFGHQNVSIHSMIQKGHGDQADLILITHPTAERAFRASMREVEGLSCVRGRPRTLMVL